MRNVTVNLLDYFWKEGIKPIKNKIAELKQVAFSGKYSDLSGQPTELKNPNALTFTGAATGSYDGSASKSVKIPSVTNNLLATQQGTALDAVQGKALNDKISQINSNLPAASWGNVTVNTDVVSNGAIQYQKYGNICIVYFSGNVSTTDSWADYKLASGLPALKYGYIPMGIFQHQDSQRAYIATVAQGELYIRTENEPPSGWMRGSITYVCN